MESFRSGGAANLGVVLSVLVECPWRQASTERLLGTSPDALEVGLVPLISRVTSHDLVNIGEGLQPICNSDLVWHCRGALARMLTVNTTLSE